MRRVSLLIAFLFAGTAEAQEPRVLVTLKPLHALVAGVMDGAGTPRLLVSGAASEHSYTLKPSDARAVAEADLVVLVDDSFETYLRRPLANRKDRAGVLRLMGLPDVRTLPLRRGGTWEADGHDHGHGDDRARRDGHLWLDPRNGQAIARAVALALGRIDPSRAALYAANAERVAAEIEGLDDALAAQLAPVKGRPFIVFHDAFQYFEARYGLAAVGSLTVDPDRQPGARRVAEMRARIVGGQAVCVFREPQFAPALVTTLLEGTAARSGELDGIGAAVPEGPAAYSAILRTLAQSLHGCLAGG